MKKKGTSNQKKKVLPERKNRGLRMAELAKNEEKMNENDMYQGIFKEDSLDDEFDPLEKNIVDSEEEEQEDESRSSNEEADSSQSEQEESIEEDEEEEPEEYLPKKKENGKQRAFPVKEVFDIDELDIDRIDFVEDMKDRGIDVSDITGEMYDNDLDADQSLEEDEEERLKKKKKSQIEKALKRPKKAKKKKSHFSKKKPKAAPSVSIPIHEDKSKGKDKKKKKVVGFDDSFEETLLNKKRRRTNKFESFLKKSKRERLNKNVQILGSRHNPRVIAISKKIYLSEEEESVAKGNDKEVTRFNLEQELDTKSIIRKFKQQEKDKKMLNYQDKTISQQERLFESIFTELENQNSLKAMQKLDDLNKREVATTNKKSFNNFIKVTTKKKRKPPSDEQSKENNKNPPTDEQSKENNKNPPTDEQSKENNKNPPSDEQSKEDNKNPPTDEQSKEDNKNPPSDEQSKENIDNKNLVTLMFSNEDHYNKMFSYFNTKPEVKEKRICAITGQPARYYDPLTKAYYASVEAFALLREKYHQKEEEGLLFRIQTLSDLASQKKEKLKKMILTEDNVNISTTANSLINSNEAKTAPVQENEANQSNTNATSVSVAQGMKESKANAILNIVNKYGILKNDTIDFDKKVISHRIYNRNRENCLESGMLLEANKIKLVISKKIFKDKFSSKLIASASEETAKPSASATTGTSKFI